MMELAELEAAGLLDGLDDPRAREDRLKLVERLMEDGFTLAEIVDAARRQRLALLPMDRVLDSGGARYSALDVAELSELEPDFLSRLWRALGLTDAPDDLLAYSDEDVDAARTVARFRAGGLADEPLVLISQVLGQAMSRLSETIREVVGQALLEAGDSELTLGLRYAQATEQLTPALTPILGYVLGVHMREQLKTDVVLQTELVSGRIEGARPVTVCFADLVGFTRLGERVPPVELGAAGRELTAMAIEAARPPVRLVKMIGDAAMLASPEPEPLVRAALDLVERSERRSESMPALRVGVASGEAISHCGDWLGAPVNLASRVTDVARPGSVLATKDVRGAVEPSFQWSLAGARRFKGVRAEVPLYRVRARIAAP